MTKARDLAELIGNSLIDGDEIAIGAVGTSNLAGTLDFSSKTMVMANDQLSGDKIHGGTVSAFTSTGIDDNATVNILTVSDTLPLLIKKTGSTSAVQEFLRLENSAGGGAGAGSSINFHHYHAGGGPAGGAKAASITAQNMASWPGGTPSSYSSGLTFGTLHENTFAERMRIHSSGKVGIGTDDPTSKLTVNSGISSSQVTVIDIHQATNGADKQVASIGVLINNGGESTNAGGMFFQTASGGALSERMRLTSSGGLELGYSGAARQQADGQAFSIITPASGGGKGIALKRLDSNNDQVLGTISWSNNTQDGLSYIVSKTDGAVNTTDIKLQVSKAGTLVTALMLDGSEGGKAWFSGQIRTDRIGTSTNSVDPLLYLNAKSSNTTVAGFGPGIVFAGDRNADSVTQQMAQINAVAEVNSGTTLSSGLQFRTATAGVNTTKMTIMNTGNVGIGTTDPDGKFTVSNGGAEGIEFFPAASSAVNSTQHYNRSGSAYVKNRTIALNHEWVNGGTDPAMNLIPDGDSTFLVLKAKASTYSSTANLSLYGTNPNINGGSVVSRATVQAQTDGTAFGTKLRLLTNNASNVETRALTVDASQNVGIGTDNPNTKLQIQTSHTETSVANANINSTLNIANSGVGNNVFNAIKFSGNQQDMYIMSFNHSTAADRRLGFFVGSVAGDATTDEKLTIRGDGDVGIGTTSPEVKLEVNGGGDGSVVFSGRSDGGNGNNRRFNLIAFADGGGSNYGGGLKIQTRDHVNIFHDRVTVKSNGNVGINNTNPIRNLDVAGTFSADNYDFGSSNAVFGQDRYKIRELNNWFWAANKRFGGYGSSSNLHNAMFDGNFDNGHNFGANSTHVITIDHRNQATLTYPSGDVYFSFYHVYNQFTSITGRAYHTAGGQSGQWSNLGTFSDISGGAGSGSRVVKMQGPPGNYIGMWEFTIVTGSASVIVTDLSYHLTRATGENSSPAFRVDRTQDVVHTTNYRNDSGTVVGTIVPTSSGCTFKNLTDYRFKQNVTDITGASARLKLLKPKNFSWTTDETDTLEDGFLAHEVAEVIPNAVIGEKDAVVPPELYGENDPIPEGSSVGDVKLENGDMEPQLLDQVKLIPLLTAALKEALDRIEVLEQG